MGKDVCSILERSMLWATEYTTELSNFSCFTKDAVLVVKLLYNILREEIYAIVP